MDKQFYNKSKPFKFDFKKEEVDAGICVVDCGNFTFSIDKLYE
jgi:hypothetical protein